jgi:TPR repeat protein
MKSLICLILLCLSAPAFAGFAEGLAAYEKKDYVSALKGFKPLAEQGDAAAQYNLGIMYADGQGTPENYGEAVKWWRKAAEQGHADAMGNLGWYTANGVGTEKNLVEAERLLKLAVSKGNDWASEKLKLVQGTRACEKRASTLIFGEALTCTFKFGLRAALKSGGLKATREDNGYWYDTYDSSAALEGSSELSVAYIEEKFAKAFYLFNSSMNPGKVVEVRNMIVSKYGQPASSVGNSSVGEVSYTWKLKDGIKVEVSRGWPDTSVTLAYIHPVNFAAMKAEQERQKQVEEAEKHSKQNKAF